jgi:hypothetical protein
MVNQVQQRDVVEIWFGPAFVVALVNLNIERNLQRTIRISVCNAAPIAARQETRIVQLLVCNIVREQWNLRLITVVIQMMNSVSL